MLLGVSYHNRFQMYMQHLIYNVMHSSRRNHAWVSFGAFSEAYNDAFQLSKDTQGHYSWSQGMGILGDKVQKSQEFVTFLPTSLLFICKRGNASLHSAQ